MKITVYELLGLIKDGKAPKKIKCDGAVYNFEYQNTITGSYEYRSEYGGCLLSGMSGHLYLTDILNSEVEILDKEDEFIDIESFGVHYSWDYIDYKNIEELKKYVNKDFQRIFDTLDDLIKNQKKIIERVDK